MKKALIFIGLSLPFVVIAQTVSFPRNLTLGSRGSDVMVLQKILNSDSDTRIASFGSGSSGNETDYFGALTQGAVMRFQQKYKTEVLYPVGLTAPTGFVGSMTRAKLTSLGLSPTKPTTQVPVTVPVSSVPTTPVTTQVGTQSVSKVPTVTGVSPSFVREGETFTVTGTNFTPTGNTVRLVFGVMDLTFSNLSSPDGKTLTAVYNPPVYPEITESMLSQVAPEQLEEIQQTLTAHYLTINDLVNPYKKFRNEAELNEFLKPYNSTATDIKDKYAVAVENANGASVEVSVFLEGMRHIAYGSTLSSTLSPFFDRLKQFGGPLMPTADAQIFAGGFHASIVMFCTCPPFGYMSVIIGAGTTPPGLYLFLPWTIPLNITTKLPGAFWLGTYTPGAGICNFLYPNFPAFCAPILTGNLMTTYGGSH